MKSNGCASRSGPESFSRASQFPLSKGLTAMRPITRRMSVVLSDVNVHVGMLSSMPPPP